MVNLGLSQLMTIKEAKSERQHDTVGTLVPPCLTALGGGNTNNIFTTSVCNHKGSKALEESLENSILLRQVSFSPFFLPGNSFIH